MNSSDLSPVISVQETCFRNIATCNPSQDLFNDLAIEPDEVAILQAWENASSQISHSAPQVNRVFQYADISSTVAAVFDRTEWSPSRFTDGTYGVWYAALDRETSIQETVYWTYRDFYQSTVEQKRRPVVAHRRMFEAQVRTSAGFDLRTKVKEFPRLTDEDHSFCRGVGATARSIGIELLLSPSVRHAAGTCVSVFVPTAIAEDRPLTHLRFIFFPDKKVQISGPDRTIDLPENWG